MSNNHFILKSAQEMQECAANFAQKILSGKMQKTATVLALHGNLGSGKTTFLQGFAKGLGVEEIVNSPTFVIMKKFQIADSRFQNFYHFDLYRLEDEKDFEFFDFKSILENPGNIVAIEWPEKISHLLPKEIISLNFIHKNSTERELQVKGASI